jgi:hypothetical protein
MQDAPLHQWKHPSVSLFAEGGDPIVLMLCLAVRTVRGVRSVRASKTSLFGITYVNVQNFRQGKRVERRPLPSFLHCVQRNGTGPFNAKSQRIRSVFWTRTPPRS